LASGFGWARARGSFDPASAPRRAVPHRGEVPEWSNGAVSKTVERASVPRVRIPPSPPYPHSPDYAPGHLAVENECLSGPRGCAGRCRPVQFGHDPRVGITVGDVISLHESIWVRWPFGLKVPSRPKVSQKSAQGTDARRRETSASSPICATVAARFFRVERTVQRAGEPEPRPRVAGEPDRAFPTLEGRGPCLG
jgi:hypothetical protein